MITVEQLKALLDIDFSPRQVAAITAPLEPTVIMAGAGSGKTSVMTARIVWLVANGLVEPHEVLGLSFTNKAAGEFRSRVRQALSQLDLAPELADAATVTTYHAFAQQLLRDDGIRIGLEPEVQLLSDVRREQLAQQVLRRPHDPIRTLGYKSKSIIEQLLRLEDALSEEAVDPQTLRDFDHHLIARLQAYGQQQKTGEAMIETAYKRLELVALVGQFRDAKIAAQAIDYADMMRLALRLVRERADVVQRLRDEYKVVLLDEYQDTSTSQRLFMTTAFGDGHPVTAVGDALQAIYEWRGANSRNIVQFPQHFPRRMPDGQLADAQVFGLPTTQRFGSRIAAIANGLSAGLRAGLPGVEPLEAESDERHGPGSVVAALHPDAASEFSWLAEQLHAEHETSSWDEMAVLLREHRFAADIYEALTSAGIPAQIVGTRGLLQIPDIAELVAYLRVINDPAANPSWVRILSGMQYRVGVRDLAHLGARAQAIASDVHDRRPDTWQEALARSAQGSDTIDVVAIEDAMSDPGDAPLSPEGRQRILALHEQVRRLRRYAGVPIADLLRVIMREIGLDIELAASDRAVDRGRRAAIEQFIELAGNFTSLEDSRSLPAFLQWLRDADAMDKSITMPHPVRRDAVSIMTVHTAKGLQREVIALPTMVEGSFPSLAPERTWATNPSELPYRVLQSGVPEALLQFPPDDYPRSKDFKAFQDLCRARGMEEETRLAYVAVTRARRRLIASAAHSYAQGTMSKPSRFLASIRDSCDAGFGTVALWSDVPSAVSVVEPRTGAFPQPLDPDYAQRLRAAVADLQTPSGTAHVPTDDEAARIATWDEAMVHHREERRAQRGALHDVPLPVALTTTQVQSLAADPHAFLLDIVRPMPIEPTYAAKRGSAFHLWVEQRFGQQSLPLDDDVVRDDDEAALADLQEKFLASEWAQREPYEQEVPFTVGLGRHSIRGRVDAVYRDGEQYIVVDWKTNKRRTANPLQLAVYREAMARRYRVPVSAVRACFFYVVHGETVWHDDEVNIATLLAASVA